MQCLEESWQESPVVSIIERPELKSNTRLFVETVITIAFWGAYIYCVLPVIQVVLMTLGFGFSERLMFGGASRGLITLLSFTSQIGLAIGATFALWTLYNYLRYHERAERGWLYRMRTARTPRLASVPAAMLADDRGVVNLRVGASRFADPSAFSGSSGRRSRVFSLPRWGAVASIAVLFLAYGTFWHSGREHAAPVGGQVQVTASEGPFMLAMMGATESLRTATEAGEPTAAAVTEPQAAEEQAATASETTVTPPGAEKTAPPAKETAPKREAPSAKVIRRGDTLYGLLLERYGFYNQELIRQIMKVNPMVKDADRIMAGRTLVFPGGERM